MLGGAQSEENSLAQSSQDLRVDSGNVDETEVSLGILPEKAQEHIEDSQRNITSCQNEVGTLGTKDEEVTAEMDKGSMVADSFRSEQECCAEDKILGESIGQLVIPKCRKTEVLKLAHTSVFSSHMCPKKTLERIEYSFFWEGLSSNVKKFCESCKECQLTRSVRIKDRSPITPVAKSELPFQVVNMDLIGPIDPPSSKGHTYILCLVDQHTRWGEARPVTSLSAKNSFLKVQMSLENSLVNVALYHIHHIWHYRARLRESGQTIGRLRKTCKNAFPRSIPVSFGRLDTPIATESSLNVHFLNFHVNCNSRFSPHLKIPLGKCLPDSRAVILYYPILKPASHLKAWFGPKAPKRTGPLNGPYSASIARKDVVSPIHVFGIKSPFERYPSQ
ncbi:retrovirus-related Pol polyprotein from transposon opus [Trichonephila clavipes]|nr:retrovirus-related Pol polyprotein from transposon opus [Trichonephila clavipes]